MVKVYEGHLSAETIKAAIVVSRFNDLITKELTEGAVDCLKRHGAREENIAIHWVPGAMEIPRVAKTIAASGKYDGILCLGAVIRGATPHFDVVTAESSKGVARLSMDSDVPVIFGIITTDSIEQALERAGTKAGNKGWTAALNLIEMVNLLKTLGKKS